MSAQLQIPCLGRPFNLGMLYNCYTDQLIAGKTLWDSTVLELSKTSQKPGTRSEVIVEDSVQKKSSSLDIEGELKLSVLSGMLEVGGAAKFMEDKVTSERQSRVTLKYSSTTSFKQLVMEQIGNIQYPQFLDDEDATHVVTDILYGANAFFVFDQTASEDEEKTDVSGKLEALIKLIPASASGSVKINNEIKILSKKISCKFYGDLALPVNPSTFETAFEVYQKLPEYLSRGEPVPLIASLEPLSKLGGKSLRILHSVTSQSVSNIEQIMDSLHLVKMQCNDLLNHSMCSNIPEFENHFNFFSKLVDQFMAKVSSDLSYLLPQIRSAKVQVKELADLISSVMSSPFSPKSLSKYLKDKRTDIKFISKYLQNIKKEKNIKFAFPDTDCELVDLITGDKNYTVCFAFNFKLDSSSYFKNFKKYLDTGETITPIEKSASLSKLAKAKLDQFVHFAKTNSKDSDCYFAISDCIEVEESDTAGPIIALYKDGDCEPELFEPPGKPKTPILTKFDESSVELEWGKPDHGAKAITSYKVLYHQTADENTNFEFTSSSEPNICISNLLKGTDYKFYVQAKCDCGLSVESDHCLATTKVPPRPADDIMKEKLTCIKAGHPAIYQLPVTRVYANSKDGLFKYRIGTPPAFPVPERVLMMVGATGAGKSTLIDGFVNYIYGVNWKDDFRFKVIAEESSQSQAHSQTKHISAYSFYSTNLNYTLTIIDTPGFGDTSGIERDKKIAKQIKLFFTEKQNGIDQLHGIGFVTQASLARLTPAQKYIFDAVLSIYGKDIQENIFLMSTFADANTPTVIDALKVADIPYIECFKFNNSALFTSSQSESIQSQFNSMFWDMGYSSFETFFEYFSSKVNPKSLALTREVLQEREQLELLIPSLQEQVRVGLSRYDEIQQEEHALKQHEADLKANKNFKYTVDIMKVKKKPSPGRVTTTCLVCNYTCHSDCGISDDSRKSGCIAMSNGYCKVCPKKCHWSEHQNLPYLMEWYKEKEERTSEDLKKRYDTAETGKAQVESMIAENQGILQHIQIYIFGVITQIRESIKRLGEIALKPNPLTEIEYLDLLIESEKSEARPGWKKRVKQYMKLRENAEMLKRVKDVPTVSGKTWWQLWR